MAKKIEFSEGKKNIIAFTLSACQQTPESPIVVGKGDRQLEQKIKDAKENAMPEDIPESGTHIQQTIKHEKLPMQILVDANVQTFDGKPMPAVKVQPHKFTQAEVDKLTTYILGDKYFADANPQADNIQIKTAINLKSWEEVLE